MRNEMAGKEEECACRWRKENTGEDGDFVERLDAKLSEASYNVRIVLVPCTSWRVASARKSGNDKATMPRAGLVPTVEARAHGSLCQLVRRRGPGFVAVAGRPAMASLRWNFLVAHVIIDYSCLPVGSCFVWLNNQTLFGDQIR